MCTSHAATGPDAELSAFLEAEQQALARGKTLKELAVGSGNLGHEAAARRREKRKGVVGLHRAF